MAAQALDRDSDVQTIALDEGDPVSPRIVGVDLSLTSTGLADSQGRVERVQTKTVEGLLLTLGRLRTIVATVGRFSYDDSGPADLVVIEGPAYASTSGQAHTRGGLWWLVADALSWYVPILVVTPAQRAMYATGKGTSGKDEVLAAAIKRYPTWDITGNDVADAVVLCAIGARLLGCPMEDSLPQTHIRALAKLTLPDGVAPC